MDKHTPGPWSVHEWKHNKKNKYPFYAVMGPHMIAELPILPESEANARLIAAAPEMLEALKDALNALENEGYGGTDTAENVRSIITKATGREG